MNAALLSALSLLLLAPPSTDRNLVAGDVVMNAMRDELGRTTTLTLPESPSPYYAAYTVVDLESVSVSAHFGALMTSSEGAARMLVPTVRVGDHERDAMGYPMDEGTAPFEDDYDALRRRLWLATDGAYKNGATSLREQQARETQTTRDADTPDAFTKREAIVHIETVAESTLDRAAFEKLARNASKVFRDHAEIQESQVNVSAVRRYRRFISTEDTLITTGGEMVVVSVSAGTQAEDGAPIGRTITLQTLDGKGPSEADVIAAANAIVADLIELRKAPALDDYNGPAIFEGIAAAQMTAFVLGSQFTAGGWGMDLEARMGQRVLPKGFSLIDDPTLTTLDGRPVFGHYILDDEGVPGQRVTLVDDGKLMGLLSTRKPTKKHPTSNGHARGGHPGWASPAPGNLVLRARSGKSDAALDAALRAQMKRAGLEHAIVITDVGDSPWSPAKAYKVDGKGKRTRVRLGNMEMPELSAFRDVLAAGKSVHAFEFLAMNGHPIGMMGGMPAEMLGFVAGTTVAAPSFLLRDVVLHKDQGDRPKPPLYKHPHFAK